MINKRTLVVANWKEHENVSQASHLVAQLHKHIAGHRDVEVVLAPSMLALQPVSLEIDRRRFRLAAQNAYHVDAGGFTGEVSFAMLQGLVHYAIIGHSERRIYFHESLEDVQQKVTACVRNGITPIICIGETKEERTAGETKQVLHDQVVSALANLTAEDVRHAVIAYEPIWAISTFGGELARPDDIEQCMKFIRTQVADLYGAEVAAAMRVLYGGSVDNHIARGYLELDDCDGVLVGSASLNYHKFAGIVDAAYRLNRESK